MSDCEERSDEAIQYCATQLLDCFAALAMTPAFPCFLRLAEKMRPATTFFSGHLQDLNALLRGLSAFPLRTLRPASGHDPPQDRIVAMPVAPQGHSGRLRFMARMPCWAETGGSQEPPACRSHILSRGHPSAAATALIAPATRAWDRPACRSCVLQNAAAPDCWNSCPSRRSSARP